MFTIEDFRPGFTADDALNLDAPDVIVDGAQADRDGTA